MSDLTPNPAWLHGLWAAVVALFWKLWAAKEKEVAAVRKDVDHLAKAVAAHNTTLGRHSLLQDQLGHAILDLRTELKENTSEARRTAETLARIETLITGKLKE